MKLTEKYMTFEEHDDEKYFECVCGHYDYEHLSDGDCDAPVHRCKQIRSIYSFNGKEYECIVNDDYNSDNYTPCGNSCNKEQ